jgi:hypothetical protein
MPERNIIFISHAAPEDNPFTLWLGAKLSALGYDVWADILRLSGGDDWQRKLEAAIRERAYKVLLVANPVSVAKQGVRNEIQIASDVGRRIKDAEFIIPLKTAPFDKPFLIAHAQYIDFESSWADGLGRLLKDLENTYKVPRNQGTQLDAWTNLQLLHGKNAVDRAETLSNWLEVRRLPAFVYYLPPTAAQVHLGALGKFPRIDFGEGIFSSQPIPGSGQISLPTKDFLETGFPALGIQVDDARRRFTALANEALGVLFELKGLNRYGMANRQTNWWLGKGTPEGRIGFRWPQFYGSRQLQGHSAKRRVDWHFGVSTAFRTKPFPHVRVKSRLLFTEDGKNPLKSAARMQRLRKSFAKSWRNARWRDMMLAFLYWIGDGTTILNVPMGQNEDLVLSLPPMSFESPISIPGLGSQEEEDDDPDIEFVDEEEGGLEDEDDKDDEEEDQDNETKTEPVESEA